MYLPAKTNIISPPIEPKPIPVMYEVYMPGLRSSLFFAIRTLFHVVQKGICMGFRTLNKSPNKIEDFNIGKEILSA